MNLTVLSSPPPATSRQADLPTGPRCISAVRVLRISLTDRCNLRCVYCMPADGLPWLPQQSLLSASEIREVALAAAERHGIRRFKLTGGEPTVRADLIDIVRRLRDIPGIEELSITTNGVLLEHLAAPLRSAGLDRVTISLDTLRTDRFRRITRTGDLAAVLRGLRACEDARFPSTKINFVTMRGINDDEIVDVARLALTRPVTVRFIEYMPLGDAAVMHLPLSGCVEPGPAGGCGAQDRGAGVFVPEAEVRRRIEQALGPLRPVPRSAEAGVGPSVVYRPASRAAGRIGFISAMSQPFCTSCNRLRLTADGVLRSCLFDGGEIPIRAILRSEARPARRQAAIARAMIECVQLKPEEHCGQGNEAMSRLGG